MRGKEGRPTSGKMSRQGWVYLYPTPSQALTHFFPLLSSTRHTSFKRHLPRQMHVSSVDYGNELPPAAEQPTSIGRIKPELYKQKSVDGEDAKSEAAKSCGKINFSLRYDYESETLIVRILKAFDLPAKDFCGSSDPYVKIYLLPDRKCKLQTRVHRKTLNPTFDENFHFPVPYEELADRKLHLSVFDFDRFSRHDMIGEVILDNLFEASDLSRETSIWKDIQYATSVSTALFVLLAARALAVLSWVGHVSRSLFFQRYIGNYGNILVALFIVRKSLNSA